MEEFISYYFSFPIFASITHRYKLLGEVSNLNELEKKISPILKSDELQKIKQAAKQLKEKSEEKGIQIIDFFHPLYPSLLKQIDKPPIVLFCLGNSDLLKQDLVSVVGTRKPSQLSLAATNLLPELLTKSNNLGIVSGVATGIDRAAMFAALNADIPTIGVLGTGLDKEYPYQNKDLYQKIKSSQKGLLITEMRIGEPIGKWSFPRRNRIISGMSKLLILMEAPLKSGAMSSVAHAIEQGREVMVFDEPELLYNEGGRKLIEDGAMKLTLNDLKKSPDSFFHISEIIPNDFNNIPQLFRSLSQLEQEGLFQNIGGGYYKKNFKP